MSRTAIVRDFAIRASLVSHCSILRLLAMLCFLLSLSLRRVLCVCKGKGEMDWRALRELEGGRRGNVRFFAIGNSDWGMVVRIGCAKGGLGCGEVVVCERGSGGKFWVM
jgi:hypothetical protein